ncbi:MAG TPA: sulfotransferase [Rhodanobacteraceae bacterium]|nr:sulfotransferase [Rhodanobacteraceae bacterium]
MSPCILVFGLPRSGTTWIGKLFDSHPETLYRHEPDSVRRLTVPLYPEKESAPRYRAELEQFVASLPRMRNPKVVGKQPLFPKRYMSAIALGAYRSSAMVAKATSRVQRNFPCLYRPTAASSERVRLVWKSIESPGRLGVCIAAAPDARAIYVVRHPCGYVASVLRGEAKRRFAEAKPSDNDLWRLKLLLETASGKARALSLEDLRLLAPEERLAWAWVLVQEKILADVGRCERVMTLRYEDVCADPLMMTKRMFEFADLDWQPQTEAFVRASTQRMEHAIDTDYYSVFKSSQASAERWRSELAPHVIERILHILHDSSLRHLYGSDLRSPKETAQ